MFLFFRIYENGLGVVACFEKVSADYSWNWLRKLLIVAFSRFLNISVVSLVVISLDVS